ncbi:hypothetical protein ACIOVF_04220 [Pseudomonas sp. NPDC087612]|uniref:hypothetical protein n=1 Tax=unclassified Pseudomonas TaxID=196821 RepID=UPI0005EB8183|nr:MULTISPECIES: hypothetical protein [unclassified Pseudomonas]KJK20336.1 hypothetical protein UB48_00945 [Pseudomonas sp. 2(2015)]QPG65672.1 hypothetical protein HFV04_013125 [Pseudomonas sp. BIGb0427]UVL62869.1 hypothetical protein LOY54_06235 [Pseudomonas sp. B21-032]UVM57187.1 hypothetical protein LOY37_06255 [Pseudomonas sp. B21-012]UVM68120.1 hypothetical protein LOY34_06180 [Pseudomonas sp. B21-009]
MQRLNLELDEQLFQMLQSAAQANNLSLEQECLRRLGGGERHSRYIQALVAELRADEKQRRDRERVA